MTMRYPRHSFEPVMAAPPPRDNSKLIAAGVTIAIHLAVALGLLAAVKVAPAKLLPHVLTVQVMMDKPKPAQDTLPLPSLARPSAVNVVMPDIQIQMVRPVMAQAVVHDAVPPPAAAVQRVAGERRESFLARLLAQLSRYKHYPREARAAHIEGVTLLHFIMDAQGRVLSFEIAKSSGRPMLDAEALALIQRAQPLPALPADYPTRTLDAVVPIFFSLNT